MNLINCKRCGADILIPDLTAEIKSLDAYYAVEFMFGRLAAPAFHERYTRQ